MNIFVTVAGWVTIVLVALSVTLGLAHLAAGGLYKLLRLHDERVETDARSWSGQTLRTSSWWFSEDEATRWLIERIALDMMTGRVPLGDTNNVREEWQRLRKQAVAKDSAAP